MFVGNFRHLPNIEAVGYLCREILPRLDAELLAAHPVTIVGNELDDRVRDAARASAGCASSAGSPTSCRT